MGSYQLTQHTPTARMNLKEMLPLLVTFSLSMGFELGTPPTPRPTEDPSNTTTAAATCLEMPECLFWTLDNRDSQHRCIPKTSDEGYGPYEGHISGVRGCLG